MIAKVLRGSRAAGLLKYLFGPGERNEHVNPRVIAGWDELHRIQPEVLDDGRPDHRQLSALLDATWRAARMTPDDRPVYHVSVAVARADPERGLPADPDLSDAQFREVCEGLMQRVGMAESCRWVGVRHDQLGESHVHIVATLATESGQRFHPPKGDFYKLGEVCREFEGRFGLRVTAPREPATPKRATSQETRKAVRKDWSQPTRMVLREKVRAVAGTSESVEDFLGRLADEGLLVKTRLSPRDGAITGYAVAMQRPSRDGKVEQVWFGGGKLAADLSLPKLRQRWPGMADVPVQSGPPLLVDRDAVWSEAVRAAADATARIDGYVSDPAAARDAAWEASDFVASCARIVSGPRGKVLREAAAGFERAGYAALGKAEPPLRPPGSGLRSAARLLMVARFMPRNDARQLVLLLAQLAALAESVERMRLEQGRAHQAVAARRAAEVLRTAAPARASDDVLAPPRVREFSRLREMTL